MPPEAAQIDEDPNVLAVEVEDPPGNAVDGYDNDDAPPVLTKAEEVAALMGWKPESEWRGDKSNWRPAEVFLSETPEHVKKLRAAVASDRAKLDSVAALVAKLSANQRRDMDARVEQELEEATEAGDLERVKRLVKQIRQQDPEPSSAAASFAQRNADWFEVNPEATAYAKMLDVQYAQMSGGKIVDQDAHLKRVEAGVKKKFPELTGDTEVAPKPETKPQERAPLAARGGRAAGSARPNNGVVTVADLTPAQRRGAEESDVSLADYAKALTKMNKSHTR